MQIARSELLRIERTGRGALTEAIMRGIKLFAAAFALAAGAFWVTMTTEPPKTVASETSRAGLSPGEMMIPADLRSSDGGDTF